MNVPSDTPKAPLGRGTPLVFPHTQPASARGLGARTAMYQPSALSQSTSLNYALPASNLPQYSYNNGQQNKTSPKDQPKPIQSQAAQSGEPQKQTDQQQRAPGARRVVRAVTDLEYQELQMDWFGIIDSLERENIDDAWNLFNTDSLHGFCVLEFYWAIKALGFDLTRPQVISWINEYARVPATWPPPDSPPDYPCPLRRLQLPLEAFRHVAAVLVAFQEPREKWIKAFGEFDADKDGLITAQDLRRVSDKVGKEYSDDEVHRMIYEGDVEEKGGVDMEEFIVIMERGSGRTTSYAAALGNQPHI